MLAFIEKQKTLLKDVHVERLNRMFKKTKRHHQSQRMRGIPSDILEILRLYHILSL